MPNYTFSGMQNMSDFMSDMSTLLPDIIPLVIVGIIIGVIYNFTQFLKGILDIDNNDSGSKKLRGAERLKYESRRK